MQASLVCLTITVVITICYFLKTFAYKTKPNRSFIAILTSANVFLALGSIYAIKLADLSIINLKLIGTLKQVYSFVLLSLITLLWHTYEYVVRKYKHSVKEEWLFGILCVLAAISTWFLSCTVKFERLYYFIGPKTYPAYVIWILFIILSVSAEIRNFKTTSTYHKVTESLILFFNGACVLLQVFYPESHFCLLGTVLLVVMLYVIVENPDLRRIEQEREINKSKNQFVSMVSHEIRTPMNVICGMVEILQGTKLNDEQKGYLDNIQKSGQSLLCIINDILDYNKMNEGALELVETPYDFYSLISDIENMLRIRIGSKPLTLNICINDSVPRKLIGDPNRVRQILINFVNNAIKFTDKGHVTVSVYAKSVNEGERLYFEISDTGQGIKEDDLNKLFHAFGQVNREQNKDIEGTGLGLSINKKLIEMMGGTVSVKSIFGEGSTFSFDIIQRQSLEDIPDTNTSVLAPSAFICPHANIVVVDDNKMNLEVFKGLIKKYRANLKTFERGADAVDASKHGRYDLFFIDRMMPEMSGEETIRNIRVNDPSVSIVALTADLSPESVSEMTRAGADAFMTKPIDTAVLHETLLNYLPAEKIEKVDDFPTVDDVSVEEHEGSLDMNIALANCGSKEVFENMCQIFFDSIPDEICYLKDCLRDNHTDLYTIRVHGLKSNCFLLGNNPLGEECLELEKAGRREDILFIKENTKTFFGNLLKFREELKLYLRETDKKPLDKAIVESLLHDLKSTIQLGDIVTSDKIVVELSSFDFDIDNLRRYVAEFDTEKSLGEIDTLCLKLKKAIA